jgi:hypothetical protein
MDGITMTPVQKQIAIDIDHLASLLRSGSPNATASIIIRSDGLHDLYHPGCEMMNVDSSQIAEICDGLFMRNCVQDHT